MDSDEKRSASLSLEETKVTSMNPRNSTSDGFIGSMESLPFLPVENWSSVSIFSTWNCIVARTLSFLEPHEAVQMRQLNTSINNAFCQGSASLRYTGEIILTVPWNRCPPEKRRPLFSLVTGISVLRIEPIVACVFVADDLLVLLSKSTDTLQRLYVCTPCPPLLLDMANSPSGTEGAYEYRDSASCHSLNESSTSIFLRCQRYGEEEAPLLGCSYFDSAVTQERAAQLAPFSLLRHIELSGNDAHLWCLMLLGWKLPSLTFLTLQTWSNELPPLSNADQIDNDESADPVSLESSQSGYQWERQINSARCSVDSMRSTVQEPLLHEGYDWDAPVTNETTAKCCVLRKNKNGKFYLQRTTSCVQRGISAVMQLLHSVQATIKELELIVPGRPTADKTSLVLSLAGTSGALDQDLQFIPEECEELALEMLGDSRMRSGSASLFSEQDVGALPVDCTEDTSSEKSGASRGLTHSPIQYEIQKDRIKSYYKFIHAQFTGFVQILQTVLFYKNGMENLEKIRFLGLIGFSSGIHALMTALTQQFMNQMGETNNDNENLESSLSPPERTASNHLPPSFAIEPGQPVLPLLNFEDTCDATFAKPKPVPGGEGQSQQGGDDKKLCKNTVPLSRCLIIFSGVLHFPQRSCLEIRVLYPDCVLKTIPFLLSCHSDDTSSCHAPPLLESGRRRSTIPVDCRPPLPGAAQIASNAVKEHTMIKVRLQQDSPANPVREFQRLQSIIRHARSMFLQPSAPRSSAKGKPPTRRKPILTPHDAPQDVSILLKECSSAITTIEIFLGDHSTSIRQFSAMPLTSLESIRIVNWNGGHNRSHLSLFTLTHCRPARNVRLTIETTEEHYERTRNYKPKAFYQSLMRFTKLLQSRGINIDRLSVFPGPGPELVPCMGYIFPIDRLHLAAAPFPFYDQLMRFQVPTSLITFFLSESLSSQFTSGGAASSYEEGQDEAGSAPVVFTVNREVVELSAPLQRGYTHIREFLVQETERQRIIGQTGAGQGSPAVAALPFVGDTVADPEALKRAQSSPRKSEKLVSVDDLVALLAKGAFFSDAAWRPLITMSCTQRLLAEFYKVVLALRSFSICKLSEQPFQALRVIMNFDTKRYGMLDSETTESPLWVAETVFLPWLTIAYGYPFVHHYGLVLQDTPTHSSRADEVFRVLRGYGTGFAFRWLPPRNSRRDVRDVVILVLNPAVWNSSLCSWVLQYGRTKIPEAMVSLLEGRTAARLSPPPQSY